MHVHHKTANLHFFPCLR